MSIRIDNVGPKVSPTPTFMDILEAPFTPLLPITNTMNYFVHLMRQWGFDIETFSSLVETIQIKKIKKNPDETLNGLIERYKEAIKYFENYPGHFLESRDIRDGNGLLVTYRHDESNKRFQNTEKIVALAKSWLDKHRIKHSVELDYQGLPQLSVDLSELTHASSMSGTCLMRILPDRALKFLDIPFRGMEDFMSKFPLIVLTKDENVEIYDDDASFDTKYPYDGSSFIPDRKNYSLDAAGSQKWNDDFKARPIQASLLVHPTVPNDTLRVTINLFEGVDPRDPIFGGASEPSSKYSSEQSMDGALI